MDSITITNFFGERFLVRHPLAVGFSPQQKPIDFKYHMVDPSGFLGQFPLGVHSDLKRYLTRYHSNSLYVYPVEQALRGGQLLLYPLGMFRGNTHIDTQTKPLYEELKITLNRIISAEQAQTAALDETYNQASAANKILINMGALFQGAIDFGVSTAETIKDTAIWAKDVFEVANPHLRAVRLITQLSESSSHPGDIQEKILDFVQKATDRECKELADVIGFDIRKFSVSAIKEALTMAAALLGDARTYSILYEFGKRFISAQHHTELLRYGVSMVFQIILGAILFILSGGASIIANIAAIARQVGKLMVKLGKVLVDLAKLLVKKLRSKRKNIRRHKGGDTSSGTDSNSSTRHNSEGSAEKKNEESRQEKGGEEKGRDGNQDQKPNKKIDDSERILQARKRQQQMLDDNIGFNISPTSWDEFPSIGRNGTFISDQKGISDILGDFSKKSNLTIDKSKAIKLESEFGLEKGTLQDGFKIRKIDNIKNQMPRSPMEGNQYFLGPGNHLPGGAPEMVIDSIPTTDTESIKTVLEVIVK